LRRPIAGQYPRGQSWPWLVDEIKNKDRKGHSYRKTGNYGEDRVTSICIKIVSISFAFLHSITQLLEINLNRGTKGRIASNRPESRGPRNAVTEKNASLQRKNSRKSNIRVTAWTITPAFAPQFAFHGAIFVIFDMFS